MKNETRPDLISSKSRVIGLVFFLIINLVPVVVYSQGILKKFHGVWEVDFALSEKYNEQRNVEYPRIYGAVTSISYEFRADGVFELRIETSRGTPPKPRKGKWKVVELDEKNSKIKIEMTGAALNRKKTDVASISLTQFEKQDVMVIVPRKGYNKHLLIFKQKKSKSKPAAPTG